MRIKLGNKYRDKTHGIEGIATARCEYLTGCEQVGLSWWSAKEEQEKTYWVDITNVEGVTLTKAENKPGGPQNHP